MLNGGLTWLLLPRTANFTLQHAMKLEAKIFLRVKVRYDDIMHWEETVLNKFRSLLRCVGCLVCGWLQMKPHKHRGTRNNECLDL